MGSRDTSITVITAVLNARHSIEKSVASVLNQQYEDLQYVVIDGGSADGTLDILRNYAHQINQLESGPDRGIGNAFNKGIGLARSELLGLLNAGDWYESHTLRIVAKAHQAHPEADVLCGGLRFWEGGEPTIVAYSDPSRLEKETSVYHPAVFITKSAYEKYGLYDESFQFAMDYELLLRFKRHRAQFVALDAVLANMSLDGVSYRHWYRGLNEVRRVRSAYFSRSNVVYRHSLAVLKNVGARLLKAIGLGGLYRKHWALKSRALASRDRRQK